MNVVKAVGWRKLRFRFDWTLTLSALTVRWFVTTSTPVVPWRTHWTGSSRCTFRPSARRSANGP